jgi:ParB family chromosome partitioning protein
MEQAVQDAVAGGQIAEGHARAMGGLVGTAQARLLGAVIARGLSVRQTEELSRRLRDGSVDPDAKAAKRVARTLDAELERVEEDLRRALGTKVSLARTRKGGRIVIEYYGAEELTRLYDRLTGGNA